VNASNAQAPVSSPSSPTSASLAPWYAPVVKIAAAADIVRKLPFGSLMMSYPITLVGTLPPL